MITQATKSLLNRVDLSFIEAREAFDEILSGLSDEIKTSSFLTALEAKKPTEDEILAGINASKDTIKTNFKLDSDKINAIENINLTISDEFLYVQLAQDIISSANGLSICQYDFLNSVDENKLFKILCAANININKKVDYNSIEFENLNFSYIYLDENTPYNKYAHKYKRALKFDNAINIISKLLNPLKASNISIGVQDKSLVQKFANIALKLNYENSIITSGDMNLPFISLTGENFVAEAWKNKIFTYVLTPELINFKQCEINEIKASSLEENSEILLEVLKNKTKNFKYDEIVINSGLSLYISKKADSIIDGIDLAKKTIDSGLAFEKLEQIKRFYN